MSFTLPRQMDRDIRTIESMLAQVQRRAINAVARKGPDVVRDEMRRVFDRPTPYALNAFRVQFASAGRAPDAAVMVKGKPDTTGIPPESFLRAGIKGGERRLKRSERALQLSGLLPTGYRVTPGSAARINAYGNMETGQILKVLSYLKAFVQQGSGGRGRRANLSDKSRARQLAGTRSRAGTRIFAVRVGEPGLPPGIYEQPVAGRRFVGPAGGLRQLMRFVKSPTYSRRLDFFGVLARAADKQAPEELQRVLASVAFPKGRSA